MPIPPRKKRGVDKTCTRTPRMFVSAVTVGAVALGATLGLVPSAAAEPSGSQLVVDIVGDSYMAGDGISDTYLDPADQRHRSRVSPALQALSRVANENTGLKIDANVVASSGAVTADYFHTQQGTDDQGANVVINTAQHHQIRPNAQVVIVGFGGNDAELAQILALAKPSNASTPGDLDAKVKNFDGLLDTTATEQTYLDQAATSDLGEAPTLVSRMLQVLSGIAERAPNARIVVTNYPLAVDPENPRAAALIKKRDLVTVQKYLVDLNETIEMAVRICECANLVDLAAALDGHEVYTGDSAYTEPTSGQPHTVSIQPNDRGAALMANPLANDLATLLGIRAPKANRGQVTEPNNITARNGESDRDGDLVLDFEDAAPEDPRIHHRKQHGPDRDDRGVHGNDRDRDGDRDRDRAPSRPRVQLPRIALPDLGRVVAIGDRDDRPGGNIPMPVPPPAAPGPKRETDRDEKPAKPDVDRNDRGPAHRIDGRIDERAEEQVDEEDLRGQARDEASDQLEEPSADEDVERREDLGTRWWDFLEESDGRFVRSPLPEATPAHTEDEESAQDRPIEDGEEDAREFGNRPNRWVIDVEQIEPRSPVEETEKASAGTRWIIGIEEAEADEPAAEEEAAEVPTDEAPAAAAPPPVTGTVVTPPHIDWPTEEPDEEPVAEAPAETPVSEAPAEDPTEAAPPADDATEGQVCVLIYPSPAGCEEAFTPVPATATESPAPAVAEEASRP